MSFVYISNGRFIFKYLNLLWSKILSKVRVGDRLPVIFNDSNSQSKFDIWTMTFGLMWHFIMWKIR